MSYDSEIKFLINQRRKLYPSEAPENLANQLLDQINKIRGMPRETVSDRLRLQSIDRTISRLQYCLAIDFGLSRGWTLTLVDFGPSALAGNKALGGYWSNRCWEFVDHTFWYRQGRRTAAVATHPYRVDDCYRREAALWAAGKNLSITYPTDFPSWWLPGRTTLVLFTSLSSQADC